MPVADNEAVTIHVGGQYHVKFRLGTGFQTQVVAFAVADNLFHYGAHLVHLDRKYDKMLAIVGVLLLRLSETLVSLLDPVVQDIGETQQHGSRYMAGRQLVHDFLQVNLDRVLLRCYINVPFVIDAKVVDSPTLDVVEFF